jgi:predicted DNA-binding transcriptional regulator AlpA
MSTIEPVLLSRKETMAMLGVMSYDTFRRLLAEGAIPEGIQIGSRLRWSKTAIVACVSRRSSKQR